MSIEQNKIDILKEEQLEKFKVLIKDCAPVRFEINEVHYKKMNKLKTIYSLVFGRDGHTFNLIKDMLHYQGGYPKPDSLPYLETRMNSMIDIIHAYNYLGKFDEIQEYFESNGISIAKPRNSEAFILESMNLPKELAQRDFNRLSKAWKAIYGKDVSYEKKDLKDLYSDLLHQGEELQSLICVLADKINVEGAEEANSVLNMKASDFKNSVTTACKKIKGSDFVKGADKQKSVLSTSSNVIDTTIKVLKEENHG